MAETLTLISAAFNSGGSIPQKFTCDGSNLSPPLRWSNLPEGTESVALIVDDPDAPGKTFVHWLLFNLPPDRDVLPEDLDVEQHFGDAAQTPLEGANDFGDRGYGGPCPPRGDNAHRYFFRLYALDSMLDLGDGVTKRQLTQAMDGHILEEADLMGTYRRGG
jgi:Raf kinase inhibitor-like YbhB/YbcL family protein